MGVIREGEIDTMKELRYGYVFGLLAGLSLATLAVYGIVTARTDTFYAFLLWNLFLAWVPFVFSSAAHALDRRGGRRGASWWALIPLGGAWLLFFPNAPYIMTDLVHQVVRHSWYYTGGEVLDRYWYDMGMLLLFTFTGWMTGFFSLYQIQSVIRRRSSAAVSWAIALAACLLGGYGVILGRVYRLNSWDVLTDLPGLLRLVTESLNRQSLQLSLFLAFILLAFYAALYAMLNMRAKDNGWSLRW